MEMSRNGFESYLRPETLSIHIHNYVSVRLHDAVLFIVCLFFLLRPFFQRFMPWIGANPLFAGHRCDLNLLPDEPLRVVSGQKAGERRPPSSSLESGGGSCAPLFGAAHALPK